MEAGEIKKKIDLQRQIGDKILKGDIREMVHDLSAPMCMIAHLTDGAKIAPKTMEKVIFSALCLLITEGHLILKERIN